MLRSTPSKHPLVYVACFAVASFGVAAGCSSRAPIESASAVSSAETVGGCECVVEGSCDDLTYANKPADNSYYIATAGTGATACGDTADNTWAYVADEARWGCGTKVKVAHDGKSCIAQVADCGPNRCVEQAAAGSCDAHVPVLDASGLICNYLYGSPDIGWIQKQSVTVTEVGAASKIGCPGNEVALADSGGGSGGGGGGDSGSSGCGGGAPAVARAQDWVTAKLHYCQAAYGATDLDAYCWPSEGASHICDRQSKSAWNPYRSDGSGFVDWAWGLPPVGDGGYVTSNYAPYDNSFSKVIDAIDLVPGDAANLNVEGADGQLVFFVEWVTPGTQAKFMIEPGCSSSEPYAQEFTSDVTVSGANIYIKSQASTWTAIRYSGNGAGCTASGEPASCHDSVLGITVGNLGCVEDTPTSVVEQCFNGGWVPSDSIPGQGCVGPIHTAMTNPPKGCESETLGKMVTSGTCVQSSTNDDWYQCINGDWVDPDTSKVVCGPNYPYTQKNNGNSCYTPDSRKLKVPDNACVELPDCADWVQCNSGTWVDEWTDATPCNGVYPYPAAECPKPGSGSGSGSNPPGTGSGSGTHRGSGSGSGTHQGTGSGSGTMTGTGTGTGSGSANMDAGAPEGDAGGPSDDATTGGHDATTGSDDSGGAPPPNDDAGSGNGDDSGAPVSTTDSIANIANDAIGLHACNPGGTPTTFESSCNGDHGQPEAWSSDFAKWVWGQAGVDVSSLTSSPNGFEQYGMEHGTWQAGFQSIPQVGDVVIFKSTDGADEYVALVVSIPNDGSIITISGNWGGGSQGHGESFTPSTSSVFGSSAFDGTWEYFPGWIGMHIYGYVGPVIP